MGISVVINTKNAAKHLERVLQSVTCFDEIVLCDMDSQDETKEIAKIYGAKVEPYVGPACSFVEPARNYAIQLATNPWVLLIDADEVVPSELPALLYEHVQHADAAEALAIPRKNFFMGRWMRGVYPDYNIRFFKRDMCDWPTTIHSKPRITGKIEKLPAKQRYSLIHLENNDLTQVCDKLNRYSTAELYKRRNEKVHVFALIYKPLWRFVKAYFIKGGCLDGLPGFVYSLTRAAYKFTTIAKLIEVKYSRRQAEKTRKVYGKAQKRTLEAPTILASLNN